MCSKPSLWSWRGDFGCRRGNGLLPSSSVSSSNSSAAFPRGRSGTERQRDRKAGPEKFSQVRPERETHLWAGQKGGTKGHFPRT